MNEEQIQLADVLSFRIPVTFNETSENHFFKARTHSQSLLIGIQ